MSKRNSRAAKARRRQDRVQANRSHGNDSDDGLVQVQAYDELVGQAERGETLPCGCDAHELLHSDGRQML
jgi:hypothetical protein